MYKEADGGFKFNGYYQHVKVAPLGQTTTLLTVFTPYKDADRGATRQLIR